MNDSEGPNRKLELLGALAISLGMIALISIVQILSDSQYQTESQHQSDLSLEPLKLQNPISVFPDFASVVSIDVKKQQFFDYLEGYINAENEKINSDRKQLQIYDDIVSSDIDLSPSNRAWLFHLAEVYQLDAQSENEFDTDQAIVHELLLRIDVIPVSLALAQAASESAWGTSRFTLEGNNVFGEWCYDKGCGIVPERRVRGAIHEVRRFDSVSSSVESYFRNINTHHLYQDFREVRARMRRQQKKLDSMELASALDRYSERGMHYIDEVQTIIKQNQLQQRDRS